MDAQPENAPDEVGGEVEATSGRQEQTTDERRATDVAKWDIRTAVLYVRWNEEILKPFRCENAREKTDGCTDGK